MFFDLNEILQLSELALLILKFIFCFSIVGSFITTYYAYLDFSGSVLSTKVSSLFFATLVGILTLVLTPILLIGLVGFVRFVVSLLFFT